VISLLRINLARGRQIPNPVGEKEKILVHRSVKTRMETGKYIPQARFEVCALKWEDEPCEVEWVD
jgi:hypothetical protein